MADVRRPEKGGSKAVAFQKTQDARRDTGKEAAGLGDFRNGELLAVEPGVCGRAKIYDFGYLAVGLVCDRR